MEQQLLFMSKKENLADYSETMYYTIDSAISENVRINYNTVTGGFDDTDCSGGR